MIAQSILANLLDTYNALTAVFAGIALLVSLYVAWSSHLIPFRPIFLISGPVLRFFHFQRKVGTSQKTLEVAEGCSRPSTENSQGKPHRPGVLAA